MLFTDQETFSEKMIQFILATQYDCTSPVAFYLFKVNNGKTYKVKKFRHQNDVIDLVLVSLLLTSNKFLTLFWCFHGWLWTSKYCLGISNVNVYSQSKFHVSTILCIFFFWKCFRECWLWLSFCLSQAVWYSSRKPIKATSLSFRATTYNL